MQNQTKKNRPFEKWKRIPKVELHSHLDCTLSFNVVNKLAPGTTVEEYWSKYVAPPRCEDLAHYLRYTENGVRLLQAKPALELVIKDLFKQLTQDNVIYTEIRFAPLLHTANGLDDDVVVDIVESACERESKESGIESRIILCTLRHYSRAQSMRTVELVGSFAGTRVAAFDISGDETPYSLEEHEPAFRFAAKRGIPTIAHAGESAGVDSVWETLRICKPRRIGHGIRSTDDRKLIQELRRREIHLEICPICNLQTGAISSLEDHPINHLFNEGLSIGINTDSRGITNTTLAREYTNLERNFGWTVEHFRSCNHNALDASFLPQEKKAALK